MRLPTLAKTTMIYGVVPVLEKSLKLILLPLYTYQILPAEYGVWAFMAAVTSFITVVGPLGLGSAYAFALRRKDGWRHSGEEIVGSSFRGAMIFATLVYLVSFPICISYQLEMPNLHWLWFFVLANGWLNHGFTLITRKFQMEQRPWEFLKFCTADALLSPLLSYVMVAHLHMGIYGIALGDFISLFVVVAAISPEFYREWKLPFSFSALKEALQFAFPLVFHALAGWGTVMLDRFMLERFSTLSEVGLYSLAVQTSSVIMFLSMGANQAYSPYFLSMVDKNTKRVRQAQWAMGCGVISLGIFWAVALPFIYQWFIGPQYQAALQPARILILGYTLNGLYFIAVNYLFYWRRTRWVACASGGGFIISFISNIYLIPRFHSTGAAWANIISKSTMLGVVLIFIVYYLLRTRHPRTI